MTRFIILLSILTGVLVGATLTLLRTGSIESRPSFLYPTLVFLFLTTVLVFRYLQRLRDPALFTRMLLLLTVVRMIAFLGYNVAMVLLHPPGASANAVFFLVSYVAFTTLEVAFLHRQITR